MRIKICGVTRGEDAEAAVEAGAWAVGLNFYPESPRRIELDAAELIGASLQRRTEVAGVFVNASLGHVTEVAERCRLSLVQLHGDEGPSYCDEIARRTGCEVIKAFRVRSLAEVRGAGAFRTNYHLFDAYRPGTPGGTGESFDWELVKARKGGVPAIVAGGLTPENVGEAIAASNPWAVDVAGGVEDGVAGVKDHDRLAQFIAAAGRAAAELRGVPPEPSAEPAESATA